MKGALYNETVPRSKKLIPNLVDHRYFYDEYDIKRQRHVGHYACGVARHAVFPMLLANKVFFNEAGVLKSLSDFIKNPSVTGYMIEGAVLESIASYGLPVPGLGDSMVVKVFYGEFPNLKPDSNRLVLHIPAIFNYKAIDGIIVKKLGNQVFIYPLQISVARSHKDSHKMFFDMWNKWIETLKGFDVHPTFIWITENGDTARDVEGAAHWPAHKVQNITIKEVNDHIGMMYELAKQNALVQSAPEFSASEQIATEDGGRPEEREEPGEQTRSDGASAAAVERGTIDYGQMKKRELQELLELRGLTYKTSEKVKVLQARLRKNDKEMRAMEG
jgi:hypothetical protein